MSKEVTYSLNDVIKDLGVEIANLKITLAKERRAKEAYQKRVEKLESEQMEKLNAE